MKLRSGKTLYTYLPDTVINPIKLELKKTIDTLKVLLENDQPFLKRIVKLSLSIGKENGVFAQDINNIVRTKYPDATPNGHDILLLYKVYDLGRLVFGNHRCIEQELSKLSIDAEDLERWAMVKKILRTELEKEVISSIFSEPVMEESPINAAGESEQLFEEI